MGAGYSGILMPLHRIGCAAVGSCALLLLIGCSNETHQRAPPEVHRPAAPAPAPPPWPSSPVTPWAASSPLRAAPQPDTGAAEPDAPVPASEASVKGLPAAPSGGNWRRCYANFQPRHEARLEVMRLGLICGPSNGMKKVIEGAESQLAGPADEREHRFTGDAGDCYRVFAIGEPSIENLDVAVYDPAGRRIAIDNTADRWPMLKPEGPFCVRMDGEYRALVRAQRGAGRYAIEIWRLR